MILLLCRRFDWIPRIRMSSWGILDSYFQEDKPDYFDLVSGWSLALSASVLEAPAAMCGFLAAAGSASQEGLKSAVEATGATTWWTVEHTVASLWLLVTLPAMLKVHGPNRLCFLYFLDGLASAAIFGCLMMTVSSGLGLGGALNIFKGRTTYPTLFVLAMVIQTISFTIVTTCRYIWPFAANPSQTDGSFKAWKILKLLHKNCVSEFALLLALAALGFPRFSAADSDPAAWLVVPVVWGMVPTCSEFCSSIKDKAGAASAPSNGSVPSVSAPPGAGSSSTEKAADDQKADGTMEDKVVEPKPAACVSGGAILAIWNRFMGFAWGLPASARCAWGSLRRFFADKVVAGLPWQRISTVLMPALAEIVLQTYVFFLLTEDWTVLVAFPAFEVILPILLEKVMASRGWMSTDNVLLAREAARTALALFQYHLFRNHMANYAI